VTSKHQIDGFENEKLIFCYILDEVYFDIRTRFIHPTEDLILYVLDNYNEKNIVHKKLILRNLTNKNDEIIDSNKSITIHGVSGSLKAIIDKIYHISNINCLGKNQCIKYTNNYIINAILDKNEKINSSNMLAGYSGSKVEYNDSIIGVFIATGDYNLQKENIRLLITPIYYLYEIITKFLD
jgi:hypothetical protein